jgi:hypothetical protein
MEMSSCFVPSSSGSPAPITAGAAWLLPHRVSFAHILRELITLIGGSTEFPVSLDFSKYRAFEACENKLLAPNEEKINPI